MNSQHNQDSSDAEPSKSPRRLRLGHRSRSDGSKPGNSSPYAWSVVIATNRRERAVEGMLIGCAIADALSQHRTGLHPRVAMKLYGRNPLHFRFQPGVGVASDLTHAMIMTIQALLRSRTDKNRFSYQLRSRITWYQRSLPCRYIIRNLSSIANRFRGTVVDDSLNIGIADDPLVRTIVLSIMLQGCTDSLSRWFQHCVEVSHSDPRALHASALVAHAAQIAQVVESDKFNSLESLGMLIESTDEPELRSKLEQMHDLLENKKSVAFVARHFGWENGIPGNLMAIALMSIYAWLRHPRSFRRAVERSVLLGGACGNVAATVGALAGILLGKHAMPEAWVRKLSLFPYNNLWKEELIDRVKDWPHGVEDIQRAKSVPSFLSGQVLRNFSNGIFRMLHSLIRFPMLLTQFSVRNKRPQT
ncbi:MAG: ADP-ribosylglycohydrolase family protein [Pirellula sp.]